MSPVTSNEILNPAAEQGSDNQPVRYRFSGHQTFPLRLSWFPKAIRSIHCGEDPLTDIDLGITRLGLGKNMVEALKCWIEAFQIATKGGHGWELTPIGRLVFHPETGLDCFLDDQTSAWLLHWLISTDTKSPFFAWECLFNRWNHPDFTASKVVEMFDEEAKSIKRLAEITIKQHWEVFIHSYCPTQNNAGEDHLDCVLSLTGLISRAGENPLPNGRHEPRYEFDRLFKAAVPNEFFAFCLHDWWNNFAPHDETVRVADVIFSTHCPGRVLKMQEREILRRLEELSRSGQAGVKLSESANQRVVTRSAKSNGHADLKSAYLTPTFL